MKKYLLMLMLFCVCVLAMPDIYALLPEKLRPAVSQPEPAKPSGYAVECVCGGVKRTLPLEEYVALILTQEGAGDYPPECLKALACVVRTRVFAGDIAPLEDISVSPSAAAKAAAVSTAGEYIAYRGEPIDAVVHKSSRAVTVSAAEAYGKDVPYLRSVPTPEYEAGEDVTRTVTLAPERLAAILKENGYSCDLEQDAAYWLTYVSRSESGRVINVRLCGNSISGTRIAQLIGLSSPYIEIKLTGAGFEFKCFGEGDGVGLSVLGARVMAERGAGYEEILVHYFEGTDILLNKPLSDG